MDAGGHCTETGFWRAPGVPDVTLLEVGSWEASVSFRGTTGLDGIVVWGTWGLEAMAILPTGRVVLQ